MVGLDLQLEVGHRKTRAACGHSKNSRKVAVVRRRAATALEHVRVKGRTLPTAGIKACE
jgi:hypothetical protein